MQYVVQMSAFVLVLFLGACVTVPQPMTKNRQLVLDKETTGRGTEVIIDGRMYYIDVENAVTWSDAMYRCTRMNMTLMSLETQQESDAVMQWLSAHPEFSIWYIWTSGRREVNTTAWIWEGTGENFTYTDWGAKQPNIPVDQPACLNFYPQYMSWADDYCHWEWHHMCEQI